MSWTNNMLYYIILGRSEKLNKKPENYLSCVWGGGLY